MLNAEKYKERIKELDYRVAIDINSNELKHCNEMNCCNCKFRDNDCGRKRTEWLLEEYKEILLTEEEKKFLLPVINAIKPFINIKPYIVKYRTSYPRGYIEINYGETTQLPLVNADECFIKLRYGKVYTLEELGLNDA